MPGMRSAQAMSCVGRRRLGAEFGRGPAQWRVTAGSGRRVRSFIFAVVIALAVAASALATPAAKDPSTLILQRKDFPAHSDYEAGDELDYSHTLSGVNARVSGHYAGTYSEQAGHLQLHGTVITTPDVATAKRAFALAEKHLQATWKTTGAVYQRAHGVPSYGEQQDSFSLTPKDVVHSAGSYAVVVRKRSFVWVLWAYLDRDDALPKMSDVLTDLKTYAAKQKARVGVG
jgi:hypothetical protein